MKTRKVECHGEWSVEIDEEHYAITAVTVRFYRYPHNGSITFHEPTLNDFRNLGEMFLLAAQELEHKSKLNKDK